MKSNPLPALLGVLVIIAMIFAPVMPAWAQVPSPTDPTGILEWLKLQGVAISLVLTLVWKYLPIVKDWSNLALPWLTLISWVVAQVGGVTVAHAASGGAGGSVSLVHAFAVGVFNSAISKALWDGWLKPTLGGWLDRTLRRTPQTA